MASSADASLRRTSPPLSKPILTEGHLLLRALGRRRRVRSRLEQLYANLTLNVKLAGAPTDYWRSIRSR